GGLHVVEGAPQAIGGRRRELAVRTPPGEPLGHRAPHGEASAFGAAALRRPPALTFRRPAGINSPTLRAVRGPSVVVVRVCVVFLTLVFAAPSTQSALASTKGKLDWARRQLHTLESTIDGTHRRLENVKREITAQESRLHALQTQLNLLAAKLTDMQAAYEHTRTLIRDTHTSLVAAQEKY